MSSETSRGTLPRIAPAFASADGTQWTSVGTLFISLPRAVHAGPVATNDVASSKVDAR